MSASTCPRCALSFDVRGLGRHEARCDPARDRRILDLHSDHVPLRRIADRVGLERTEVRRVLERYGVERASGWKAAEEQKRLGGKACLQCGHVAPNGPALLAHQVAKHGVRVVRAAERPAEPLPRRRAKVGAPS